MSTSLDLVHVVSCPESGSPGSPSVNYHMLSKKHPFFPAEISQRWFLLLTTKEPSQRAADGSVSLGSAPGRHKCALQKEEPEDARHRVPKAPSDDDWHAERKYF